MNKQNNQTRYIELAKKLGKLPSRREVRKLLGFYIDEFGTFRAELLKKHPELEQLEVKTALSESDIDTYVLDKHKTTVDKKNNKILETISKLRELEIFLKKTIPPVTPVKPFQSKEKTKRILNLVFSDVHIGADVNRDETGVANYGKIEESRRVAAIVKEVINYKIAHRNETELEVLLLGDLFQNQLHDQRDGAPLAEQLVRTLHIFTQAIQQLAANFKMVRVRCQSGNHARNKSRHHDRAVNQKWDSFETVVYYALKTALSAQKNVEFFIPKTPYGIYEVFGQKVLYTHGDTFLNPGYPGKSINIKNLEGQINKINASLHDKKEFKVAIVGHVHTASQTYLSNGCVMITNGALIEPDEYAVSIGIIETNTGQMLFESFPGFAVGDTRYIRASYKEDKDKSLDSIIKPWKNL